VNYCWYISCFSDVFIKYFRELGLETSSIVDNVLEELFELSLRMFDTRSVVDMQLFHIAECNMTAL
jgi:hypothetical protein